GLRWSGPCLTRRCRRARSRSMTARLWLVSARTASGMARTSKQPMVNRRTTVRRLVGGLCLLLVLFQSGCFSYLPLQSELPQTQEVRVVLNDRGRATVADGVG